MIWSNIVLVGWILARTGAIYLEDRNTVNETAIQQLPECVSACSNEVSQRYECRPIDPCYCDNSSSYVLAQGACVKANCTLDEQLESKRLQARTCDLPVHDEQLRIAVVVYTLFAVAVVFTVARLLSRWRRLKGGGFWWDDLTVFTSSIAMVALVVDGYFAEKYGLGKDMWDLSAYQLTHFLEVGVGRGEHVKSNMLTRPL